MRFDFLLVFILIIFFSACVLDSGISLNPIYPNKNLQEFIIYGSYDPVDENRVEEIEKTYRDRAYLTDDESLAEKYPFMATFGDESFNYKGSRYCYNKTQEKEAIINENLRTRLYDEGGRLLTEDFLRVGASKESSSQQTISYVPYHPSGHKIFILKLEGEKEVVLFEKLFLSQSRLREISWVNKNPRNHTGRWIFDEKDECHIPPPIR